VRYLGTGRITNGIEGKKRYRYQPLNKGGNMLGRQEGSPVLRKNSGKLFCQGRAVYKKERGGGGSSKDSIPRKREILYRAIPVGTDAKQLGGVKGEFPHEK